MQPHYPFIGKHKIIHDGVKNLRNKKIMEKDSVNLEEKNPWDDLAEGKVSLEEFMTAYTDNLKLVLKNVKSLLPSLEGEVIITSDHGNCLGEMGLHHHPGGYHIKPLIEVPWLVVKDKD